ANASPRVSGILRAASATNLETVRKFIAYGMDVNQQHPWTAKTALYKAVSASSIPMVELLLDNGADMTMGVLDGNEYMPLYRAVELEDYEMLN
ncbi:ankyrin repeat-containing protein, partial [Aspergillus sclerotialis]